MNWNDHSREVPEGSHAFLSASKYSWLNYSPDKLKESYINALAKQRGTMLHAFAAECISLKQPLPRKHKTLNMYVNDALNYRMRPEQVLFYSFNCYGTADAIAFKNNFLRIHDLKTGLTPASPHQLEIYAALFCLEYKHKPGELKGIELRIYQNDNVEIFNPGAEIIAPIMDTIITFDKIIEEIQENDGYEY